MRLFAAVGRFSVHHRLLVVVLWLVAVVGANAAFPSLGSVAQNDNTSFLPASAPDQQAAELAAALVPKTRAVAVLVVSGSSGPITADQAQIDALVSRVGATKGVLAVHQAGVSGDGSSELYSLELGVRAFSNDLGKAKVLIDRVRAQVAGARAAPGFPPGLVVHLTGAVPSAVDSQNASRHQQRLTELLSVLFIVALLFVVFRALLAPVVTLLPAAISLAVSQPVIAEASKAGLSVSTLVELLLTVVVLGAGTDYGLFLIFRTREELRRGRPNREAIEVAVTRVGESISFSALTVIAAMLSLLFASFGLYRGLGPGLAIGIGFVLVANLTLLPALLALFGRAVFWPTRPLPGEQTRGRWGEVAARVVRHPVPTLVTGLVVFGGLSVALVDYAPGGFGAPTVQASSDSSAGQAVVNAHFSAAQTNPTDLVFRFPGSLWADPSPLVVLEQHLAASGHFTSLAGPLDPTGARGPAASASDAALLEALHAQLGAPQDLPPNPPPGFSVPWAAAGINPAAAGAIPPDLVYREYLASGQFLTRDGTTTLFAAALRAGDPASNAAINAVPALRTSVAAAGRAAGASQSGVAGLSPAIADVASVSAHDLARIIPFVLVVLALLLALVLRSLVAPLYLVASVGLSYLATLGFATLAFVVIGGGGGLNFILPFFMFIFIMALGEDYNILVMSRIREEAHDLRLADAIQRAVEVTGTTVTSAGLILAGTFTVLTVAAGGAVREIGVALAVGILFDTFVVRTVIVPATALLVGRWNWWPSRLFFDEKGDHTPAEREARGKTLTDP